MTHKRLHILLTLLCLGSLSVTAQDYYVATTGNDAHPGTLAQPFKTIQHAADRVSAGGTVFIRRGTYRESVTVRSSGTANSPVTFQAYPGEDVVLSAGDLITGWTRHAGDIWKASAAWNLGSDGSGNTLFVDGVLKFEAREGAENDPMDLDNWGQITSGNLKSDSFTSNDIKGWGDDFWNGAKVRNHVNDWTISTRTIADYDSSSGRVTFGQSLGVTSQKHTIGFYIYDTIKALDQAGEWFKDRSTGTLYYQVSPGQDPNHLAMEFKHRDYAFDVRGRDHIHIKDLTLRGASIRTDGGTDFNLYQGNRLYAYDKANVGRFYISGRHNIFRDNEVSQIWGSVVSISGTRNQLVNNFLHDIGYNGTSRVITMSGSEHLVSHNTVRTFARSFLDGFPYRSEFSYNLFEDGANLSWDTGVFDGDSGRGNGGGCTIHHNLFRNTDSIGIYMAFYSGTDLVIHHNIVHDLAPWTMRVGVLNFLKYYHNTWIGESPIGNVNAADRAVESNYNNNLQVTIDNVASIGVDFRGNHNYQTSDFVNFHGKDYRLTAGSGAIDAGVVLPEINDGYSGAAPDAGALEYGEAMWPVGHDFSTPHRPEYSWKPLPGTNIFDDGQFRQSPSGWIYTGSPVWFDGNAWNTGGTGLSRAGGRCFQLNPRDGIRRTFTGLKPSTWYTVGSETRLTDQRIEMEQYAGSQGSVSSSQHRGENYVTGLADGEWVRYDNVPFGLSGQYDQLELTYTRPPGTPQGGAPATLEVRSGSADGPVLGAFTYNPAVVDSWYATQIEIPEMSGNQTLYVLGKGGGADIMRLATIRLLKANIIPDRKATIGVRDYGGPEITTQIGEAFWRYAYETFSFKTGPGHSSAQVFVQNNGWYDAYLDRLALFEQENPAVDAAASGFAVQSSTLDLHTAGKAIDGEGPGTASVTENLPNSWWQVDLGEPKDVHQIKVTAPEEHPGHLSRFRVSVWGTDPRAGGQPLWQRDYHAQATLGSGESLVIKGTDRSKDGATELQTVSGRFVRVQLIDYNYLRTGNLRIGNIEVSTYDDLDLVDSDGDVLRESNLWQVKFAQVINLGDITLRNTSTEAYTSLSDFNVSVWDRDPDEGGQVLWEKNYLPSGSVALGGTFVVGGDEIGTDGYTRLASVLGRVIQIRSNQAGVRLQLVDASVRSAADAPPGSNVALGGVATQSSNLYTGSGLAPVGNNGIVLPKGDFTSTLSASKSWWQVDLLQAPTIDQIVVYNRTDAASRLGNFRVSVWDQDPEDGGRELWGRDYSYWNGDLPAGGSLTINGNVTSGGTRLDRIVGGQVVRVQLKGSNILSLPEVQVWTDRNEVRIDPAATALHVDLGPVDSPVQEGWTGIRPSSRGDAWWEGQAGGLDRGSMPGVSEADRDFVYGDGPATLHAKVQDGTWEGTLFMGDFDQARDQMMVWAEGSLVSSNVSSAAREFTAVPFTTYVTGGELSLQFDDLGGGDPDWVLNRFSLVHIDNERPAAHASTIYAYPGAATLLPFAGSDPDNDPLSFRVVEPPVYGTLVGTSSNLTYVPSPGFTGEDRVVFVARDNHVDSLPATLTLRVDLITDSDGDGQPDSFEQTYYGHPTDNTDGTDDLDGDGVNDRDELLAGTDPTDPDSVLRMTMGGILVPAGSPDASVNLEWYSVPGRTYTISACGELMAGPWEILDAGIVATSETTSRTIEAAGGGQYFRISVQPL